MVKVLSDCDIYILRRPFQVRRRGGVQTKTSERAARLGNFVLASFIAPSGGRYQTVFRGTLPRRCSIRRSRWDNTLTITLHQPYLRHFPFHSFFQSTQPINNVIFHYIKKHCKNSCLNCVNIVKYIRLSGRKLAKCKNISNLART